MDYKETETSKMLKRWNDLIFSTTQKFFKTKSTNVRNGLQKTLSFLNNAVNEYTLKREEEIAEERIQPIELPNGQVITKSRFIDTQRMYELDDEETANYLMMTLC